MALRVSHMLHAKSQIINDDRVLILLPELELEVEQHKEKKKFVKVDKAL